jgi:S1-C subfamily serine protease
MRGLIGLFVALPLALSGCTAQDIGEESPAQTEIVVSDEALALIDEIKIIQETLSGVEPASPVTSQVEGEKRLRGLLAENVGKRLDGDGELGTALGERFSPEEISEAREVASQLRQSVVVLATTWEEFGFTYEGDATAWMISPNVAITNDHNLADGNNLSYINPDGIAVFDINGNEYGVEGYLELNPDYDVAAILLDSEHPGPYLDLAGAVPAEVGDVVVAVGHPAQIGYWVQSIGRVTLYSPGRDVYAASGDMGGGSLHVDIGISDGSSGSPVVNLDGQVVGILHSSPAMSREEFSSAPFAGGPVSILPAQRESFGTAADDLLRIMGGLLP